MVQQTIPVLDLAAFRDKQRRGDFVKGVAAALETIGFFALINSEIDQTLIHQAYLEAERFFLLPEADKRRYEYPQLHGQRGFIRFGQEHAKNHSAPDLKEFWHLGRADHQDPRFPYDLNPTPQFLPIFGTLFAQMERCGLELLEAIALSLGEDQQLLHQMATDGESILRVIHYPPLPPNAQPESLRAAPHEDINLITLLCEATDDGLELLQPDGTWLAVRSIPGQIIVDSGDMLQWLTNGLYRSTTHRVINPSQTRQRRFSLPFFLHPRLEVDLTPLHSCVERLGQANFGPITAGAYLAQRLAEIGLQTP
jgi:isopenicillin N synthase-like dioxygenase